MAIRFPKSLSNPIALLGLGIACAGGGAAVVALFIDINQGETRPYQGLLTFMLFPAILFLGLGVFGAGVVLERKRSRKLEESHEAWRPMLDPRIGRHLGILLVMGGVAMVLMIFSIIGSYRAYEFTESPVFCGAMCHGPMGPQFVAYAQSPHARISCSHCHVGPGVEHYLEAKISGLRQVYQMTTNSYPRPIRAPHDKILPANETCEHCHWPDKFWGTRFDQRTRFGYDVKNSERFLQILPKVGGGNPESGTSGGIHAHMNLKNRVFFKAEDELLQVVPWVKVVHDDGSEVVYVDPASELSHEEIDALPEQRMDCLDCHNRPAHRFLPPDVAVDQALVSGALDPTLPYIKKLTVEVLGGEYDTTDEALAGIRQGVEDYYRYNFEGSVLARRETLDKAVQTIQDIYQRNVFPEMNVDWTTYPANDGHRTSPGCFRCHSGRHASASGQLLDSDCSLCHLFAERSRDSSSLREVNADASFLHPFRDAAHLKVDCWQCHSGAQSPYGTCGECHDQAKTVHGMRFECSICHEPGETANPTNNSCLPCHPRAGSPLHQVADHGDCLACHQPHDWKVDYQQSCRACHTGLLGEETWEEHHPGQSCSPCHDFRGVERHLHGLPIGR